ncbi:hypothetical protein AC578_3909 [Pseudocercospora eumusae]|uniref:Ca2+-modulated nonselective cation channel polycystin n=1 Tax=Pseudocercospora eumusae TaxID=321146 RepID=A0A139H0N1_9PEZI|nr:hypothetical protein AC578_3909 [Pseudocercospora eumusae]
MRCTLLSTLAPLVLASALPIPRTINSMPYQTPPHISADIDILHFDLETACTQFAVAVALTTPLVFELNVNPVQHSPLTSNITVNQQPLDIRWNKTADSNSASYATIDVPITQVLAIEDKRGESHAINVTVTGFIGYSSRSYHLPEPEETQHLQLHVLSVDGQAVKHFELDLVVEPNSQTNRLQKLFHISDMQPGTLNAHLTDIITSEPLLDATPFEKYRHAGDGNVDIEAELESLLLLEAEAGDLNSRIAAKKQAIAQCLKSHRDQATLGHLLGECDGIVCAAKVIAQRICDKMGVLTEPDFQYVQMKDSQAQRLIQIDEDGNGTTQAAKTVGKSQQGPEKHNNVTISGDRYFALHINGGAVNVVYPQNVLFRVLSIIAGVFGLTALFSIIRRKCRSARSKVDRLAAQEERRNARAYRKAARRAEMRRRWNAFISSISCFPTHQEPPSVEDYEEKRALILQDAFLEQDMEAAEKGEVMEAEIRELRHAHEIVSGLVGVDEHRYDLRMPMSLPVDDPPPPLVPLPYDSTGRSRASTGTLPSYTSEILPDYRSRISVAASSSINDGSTIYSPTTSSEDEVFTAPATGSTPRSSSPSAGSIGTRGTRTSRVSQLTTSSRLTRYTPASSVIEVSPRCSEDTLRTSHWRQSMRSTRRSRDTNDL